MLKQKDKAVRGLTRGIAGLFKAYGVENIAGTVIGLELGSVWARLGAKVHVVEFADSIMGPACDKEVASSFLKILQNQGISFSMGSAVTEVKKTPGGGPVKVVWENRADKSKTEAESEKVLISTGRLPNTKTLGLEDALGVKLEGPGRFRWT